ncbi:unnamed protein product [Schistosoma mattheei]|uniref:Uncharacterized protein n=1 Tax=Schistosoma mattheei TaxID=31246 RepID=A0A183NR79_9TREM|nr:unnamed protein product [Schistosoma mattheei]
MPITNIHRRLGRWAEFFEGQFNWSAAPGRSVKLSCPPWPVTTDPPNEAEVVKDLRLLKRYKSPGPDDLPPALFKDGGDFLVKELTALFTKVWKLESVPTSWNESIVVPIFRKGSRHSGDKSTSDCVQTTGLRHTSYGVQNPREIDLPGAGWFSFWSSVTGELKTSV